MNDSKIILELLLMIKKDNNLTWEELRAYNHITCIAFERIRQDDPCKLDRYTNDCVIM